MSKFSCGIALAVSTIMAASPVSAGVLHFAFHDELGSDNFSFDLPSSTPIPDFSQPNSNAGFFVSGTVQGAPDNFEVSFYNMTYSGGLSADDLANGGSFYFQNGFGQYSAVTNTYQQIYSGVESAPTFTTGEFTLYAQDPETFESSGVPEGVLIVSAVSAAPEPSLWALLLVGVGGLGQMLRRGRSKERLAAA